MPLDQHKRCLLALLCANVFFCGMNTLVKVADHIPFFKVALFRFSIGMAVLGLLAIFKKIDLRFVNSPILLVRGSLGGIAVVLLYFSIQELGLATGTMLSFTYPIFACVAGWIFLGEKVNLKTWVSIAAAFGGIYLISVSGHERFQDINPYYLLAILGAMLAGISVTAVRKLHDTDNIHSIFFSQCVLGFCLVILPSATTPDTTILATDGLMLLGIGLAAACGQLLLTYGFGSVTVATGALMGMFVPVLSCLIGYAFFSEDISLRRAIGMGVVLVACLLVAVRKKPAAEKNNTLKDRA